ncbi:hypothetical protein E3E26_01310 [Thermococcus sp. LS1]|uniref:transglutaminase domain-containing protein n=1 Tax=Thermococcus sp. LS1 TaxID=1638259 RepID=UPI00143936CB|nr:transglutaminase domain-containing protein [Thermococcus sp. LS1]NJD98439.1 hypothetical protein [Thermococcus sp. LS1]
MVRRKYVAFFTLILLSTLLASSVLGPALIRAPPQTKSLERFLLPREEPGNYTNETGPPIEVPGPTQFMLLVTGAAHTHYLRLNVYTDYVDGRWVTRNATAVPGNVIAPPEINVPHHAERDEITVISFFPLHGNLYTSLYTTRVNAPGIEAVPEYNLFRTNLNISTYSFSAVSYTFDWPYLLNLTAENQTLYLSAPEDVELKNFALSITSGESLDYLKALKIVRYLANNYRYFENPSPPNDTDRLKWFLFESKAGNSYDFASALVILARLNGLPARLVEGVYIDAVPETQVVTEKNLHFWAEIYFEKAGWLIFDPFHPDPNPFIPFELEVSPTNMTLSPRGYGEITAKFMRVASGTNATVTVMNPTGKTIATFEKPGIYNVRVGPFEEPGYYPIMVNASTNAGVPQSIVHFIPVIVPGNFTVVPEVPAASLAKGDIWWLDLDITGDAENPKVITSSELVYSWTTVWGKAGVSIGLQAPHDSRLGWHVEKIVVVDKGYRFPVYLPIFVIERTDIRVIAPNTVTAGDSFKIGGAVSGTITGEFPEWGIIYAFLSDGQREILIGYTNISREIFTLRAKIPEYMSPGTKGISIYYIPPIGHPYFPSRTETFVTVRGLAKFSVPELVLARPGNITIAGTLIGGDKRPIANVSIEYYLDGNLIGTVNSSERGEFSIILPVPSVESHTLTLRYPGSSDYSPATAEVDVAAVELKIPETTEAELGRPVKISGRLVGVQNATLEAYIYPGKTYTIQVVNGSFTLTLESFPTVGDRSIEFRHGAYTLGRSTVVVVSPVEIKLLTSRAEGKEEAQIRFQVVDSTNEPIKGVSLDVVIDGLVKRVMTNSSGVATVEVPVLEDEVNATVKVLFEGSTYYLPTQKTFHVVIARKRKIPWLYIGIALLIGAVIIRYRLVRKKPPEAKREKILKIIFNNGIPLFREGETMEISIECEDEPELYVDGELVGKGREFRLKLPLGKHILEVRCGELVEKATARIVKSYNEAVVDYYEKCFLPWAKELGLDVDEMTPREISTMLTDMMYPWEPLDLLTEIFERAKYSHREVSREEFIRFYRALLTLVGGGCVV